MLRSPIARTGTLKRSSLSRKKSIGRAKTLLKSSRPKSTPIRRAARGQDCTLMIPGVCNRNPETTVLCHSNRLADGKGMGLKAPDTEACFGCSDCHDVLDGRRPLPAWMSREQLDHIFDRARAVTQDKLKQEGLMP